MKIAIAGVGDVGTYFIEEFSRSTHEVVLLTSKPKSLLVRLPIEQRITDYSIENLTLHLRDCDAVVSTFCGPEDKYITAHLAMLEACTRSPKCKRFLPSSWTTNIEDFGDQPIMLAHSRNTIWNALRSQHEIKWTMVCNGWFMDYVLPASQRYLRDVGVGWVMDHQNKVFELYADGQQKVTLTSVRDVARAALSILEHDDSKWNEVTHFGGQTITYLELYELIKRRDPSWTLKKLPFAEVIERITSGKLAGEDVDLEYFRLMGFTNCNRVPEDRALTWGTGLLEGLRARGVEEFLDEAAKDEKVVP
ncbi:hypothetical protein BDV27DRAFT_168628 [Aspergillus caelatus]|uniref:Uncharacterized protein n=1 Tax=Aspergillus caelatus TaxID=61420 RepID=A0A5N7AFS6_9EURO|nr:uncharacterized protein BDV27DRAFT_168628 [Aspergillus caelatus]KAE8368026.1 hypothetical protein BDV27DRAFT_168628 [Aspergillus caelatus]